MIENKPWIGGSVAAMNNVAVLTFYLKPSFIYHDYLKKMYQGDMFLFDTVIPSTIPVYYV